MKNKKGKKKSNGDCIPTNITPPPFDSDCGCNNNNISPDITPPPLDSDNDMTTPPYWGGRNNKRNPRH